MSLRPFPSLREAFSEVRRKESKKRVMLGSDQGGGESSTLVSTNRYNDQRRKGKPWCDHCKRSGHSRETCWVLHGKPKDWKSNRSREAHAAEKTEESFRGFSKEQVEEIRRLLSELQTTPRQTTEGESSESLAGLMAHSGTICLGLVTST